VMFLQKKVELKSEEVSSKTGSNDILVTIPVDRPSVL